MITVIEDIYIFILRKNCNKFPYKLEITQNCGLVNLLFIDILDDPITDKYFNFTIREGKIMRRARNE